MNDARGEVLGLLQFSVSAYKEVVQSRLEITDTLHMGTKTEVSFSDS
jgi:hypothetical protein